VSMSSQRQLGVPGDGDIPGDNENPVVKITIPRPRYSVLMLRSSKSLRINRAPLCTHDSLSGSD
jgi:hypothetical protein